MKLNTLHQIFSQDKAQQIARQLNDDQDDDWLYVVEENPNPNGPKTAIIHIYDKNGDFVALL
jgi:hypothetical protein